MNLNSILCLASIILIINSPIFADSTLPDTFPIQNINDARIEFTIGNQAQQIFGSLETSQAYYSSSLVILNTSLSNPLHVISPGRGIITRIAEYNIQNTDFFEVTINHTNGFESVLTDLTEINVDYQDFISKGQEIGLSSNHRVVRHRGIKYQLKYNGVIINPEIIVLGLNHGDFSIGTLTEITDAISQTAIEQYPIIVRDNFIEYNSKQFPLKITEIQLSNFIKIDPTKETIAYSDPNKPEYDELIFDFGIFKVIRYRYSATLQAITITSTEIQIFDNQLIGSSVSEVLSNLGIPFRTQFHNDVISRLTSIYILQNHLDMQDEVSVMDFIISDHSGNSYTLLLDIQDGVVSAMQIQLNEE
ncbi:peptidoglycan DD-metalloendopeptidase family protein [Spirochaeta lutea]|uniref:M23ase beta-sheet core domain-containing protein n=1 Tax=Spirochaeta lutea TaxID=1480694 RepID=A0A098R4H3_9SPIO|nr:peptidoglycan DD-metalloendopeptidase family protein [Spirochaeta lutea]KGE73662.1 hypothetical protein DC28_01620 [Spirochaeta lutea]